MRILVLGAGRMGLGATYDLAHSPEVAAVTLADLHLAQAEAVAARVGHAKVQPRHLDVTNAEQVVALMRGHDAVLSCVTYHLNLSLAHAAIRAGSHFCDLGGNNEIVAAQLVLDAAARAAGVYLVPDCGLAPGLVSLLAAHGAAPFDEVEQITLRVGGLPQSPRPPLDYQLCFSVEGLINEYVERARVLREGVITEVESLTEVETLDFPPFGQLEAFHTSGGISTLPESFLGRVRNLDYKTIRYPGHAAQVRLLMALGLASMEPLEVDGATIRPRRVLETLLTEHLPAGEPDVVLVRVEVRGWRAGRKAGRRYEIIDRYDPASGLSAMMRTTAFSASIIAQMMARGELERHGAIPQERGVPAARFIAELAARHIQVREQSLEVEQGAPHGISHDH